MKRLRERARVRAAVRRFFDARDFVEVETPAIVPSPGLDLHLDAYEVGERDGRASRWLSTSPEYQMKRLLAEGYSHIYQLAPCFRRDESGTHHNPQFTMLEWYRASADVEDVIGDTEQLLAEVTRGEVRLGPRTLGVLPPIERLPVCEAFARFAGWTVDNKIYTYAYYHVGLNGEDVGDALPNGTTDTGKGSIPNGTAYGPNNVPGEELINNSPARILGNQPDAGTHLRRP